MMIPSFASLSYVIREGPMKSDIEAEAEFKRKFAQVESRELLEE